MKRGKRFFVIFLIVVNLLLISFIVFSQYVGGLSVLGKMTTFGPLYSGVKSNYASTPGISHTAGEIPYSVYSDYLRVSGADDNTRLLGINQITQSTYIVPLLQEGNCNALCRYTLGGTCKAVVPLFTATGDWLPTIQLNDAESQSQKKLVLNILSEDFDPSTTCGQSKTEFSPSFSHPICI